MKTKTSGFIQEPNKTWTIDKTVSVNGTTRHLKRRGFKTLSEAKAAYESIVAEFKEDIVTRERERKERTVSFEELLDDYRRMRAKSVKRTTSENDEFIYDIYMREFRDKPISEVSKRNVRNWYESLVGNKSVSDRRKSKVVTRMKDLLLFAFNHKYIDADTYQDCTIEIYPIKSSKKARTERVIWTEDEEKRFFDAIDDKKDEYMFRMFFFLGARIGEFLAIQPKCFDKEFKRVAITQQVVNLKGHMNVTESLKTEESYRSDLLTSELTEETKEYIKDLCIGNDEFLFFARTKGQPMGRSSFRRKLDMYCDKANVRKINPHAARHMVAVKMASKCDSAQKIEAAAKRLGHSPEMFMNTYAKHSNEELERMLIENL